MRSITEQLPWTKHDPTDPANLAISKHCKKLIQAMCKNVQNSPVQVAVITKLLSTFGKQFGTNVNTIINQNNYDY